MTHDTAQKSYLFPVILWVGAFLCSLNPVNEFQLEFLVGTVVLTFIWSFCMLSRKLADGWEMPRRSPILMLAGAFWALVILSVFWSEVKPLSFASACFFSVMPLTFFVGVMNGDETYFRRLWKPLAAIFAVLGLWAVFQFFFLNAYFIGQARHPLADPSSLGALLSLAFFCALGWAVSDRSSKERGVATALSVILLCGIMSTVSRGPVVAFIPGFLLFIPLLWTQIKLRWKTFLLVVVAAAAFQGLMATNVQKHFDLAERFSKSFGSVAQGLSREQRIDVWESSAEMIEDAPLLGHGIGTFFLYYPEYRKSTERDGAFYAHNDPLQFWVELGILGPILFYGFVITASVRTFRALKPLPANDPKRIIIVTVFCALAAMVAQSHISFNHYNSSILMMTGLLLSVWFILTGKNLAQAQQIVAMPDNMPPNLNKALLALPFLMVGWLYVGIMGGEYSVNKARDALFAQDMQTFMENINRANHISMGLNYRAYMFAVNVPMAILEDRKSTLNAEQQKKLYDQVVGYMETVLALNPRMASAYYYLAKVQTMVAPSVLPEKTVPPEDLYRKALELDPLHLGARMELLKLYKAEGKGLYEQIALMEEGYKFNYNTEMVIPYYNALASLYLETRNYGKMQDVLLRRKALQDRSDFSRKRQSLSIPQAVMGGDDALQGP